MALDSNMAAANASPFLKSVRIIGGRGSFVNVTLEIGYKLLSGSIKHFHQRDCLFGKSKQAILKKVQCKRLRMQSGFSFVGAEALVKYIISSFYPKVISCACEHASLPAASIAQI